MVAALAAACRSTPKTDSLGGSIRRAPRPPDSSSAKLTASPATALFIEDDFEAARAQARASGKLLFVDVWARWCAPCVVFRQEALADPRLATHMTDFVFVSLELEREENSAFFEVHKQRALPTALVVDPTTNQVLAMRSGALTFEDLELLLGDGLDARTPSSGRRALIAAHARYETGDRGNAAREYRAAAKELSGAARVEAALAAADAFAEVGDDEACAATVDENVNADARGSAPRLLALALVRCATRLTETPLTITRLEHAEALLANALKSATTSATERAETLALYAELLARRGDHDGASKADAERLALLEQAAAGAPNTEYAGAMDHARVKLYLGLGRVDEAVALLTERARERPDSYEAHGRLGTTLLELGRAADAVAPLERAIELAYGPPRLVYQGRLAAALLKVDRCDDAARVAAEAVVGWTRLSPSLQDPVRAADAARLESETRSRCPATKP
ncbi:MAG: thioredoxin family protein [Polyangiaceae bacterium]